MTAIPVLDLAPYLADRNGALKNLAAALRDALERVGFFFIVNHGVPQALIDRVFAEAARFHALPLEEKLALRMSRHNTGYVPLGGGASRASAIADAAKPNLNEAFFMKRDRPSDHPDVLADIPFRGLNQWPDNLPGYRETLVEYFDTLETLGKRLLPVYATALDLPRDFFAEAFDEPQITLRLSHYPPVDHEADQFGLAPHTDAGFMTMLAQNELPGLAIRPAGGDWIDAPMIPGSFLVNAGDTLKRWTNDRFLSTEHRVLNATGRARYAIPYFFDPRTDYVIECLPTCQGPDNPPRYKPVAYGDYLTWFMTRNYRAGPDDPAVPPP